MTSLRKSLISRGLSGVIALSLAATAAQADAKPEIDSLFRDLHARSIQVRLTDANVFNGEKMERVDFIKGAFALRADSLTHDGEQFVLIQPSLEATSSGKGSVEARRMTFSNAAALQHIFARLEGPGRNNSALNVLTELARAPVGVAQDPADCALHADWTAEDVTLNSAPEMAAGGEVSEILQMGGMFGSITASFDGGECRTEDSLGAAAVRIENQHGGSLSIRSLMNIREASVEPGAPVIDIKSSNGLMGLSVVSDYGIESITLEAGAIILDRRLQSNALNAGLGAMTFADLTGRIQVHMDGLDVQLPYLLDVGDMLALQSQIGVDRITGDMAATGELHERIFDGDFSLDIEQLMAVKVGIGLDFSVLEDPELQARLVSQPRGAAPILMAVGLNHASIDYADQGFGAVIKELTGATPSQILKLQLDRALMMNFGSAPAYMLAPFYAVRDTAMEILEHGGSVSARPGGTPLGQLGMMAVSMPDALAEQIDLQVTIND